MTIPPVVSGPWLGTLSRAVLGGVWAAAAIPKAADPIGTANSVRAYQMLPDTAAAVFGYALPWVELVLALLLLTGVAVRASAAATGILMVVFIVGVTQAWMRGLVIDCGCFGTTDLSDGSPAWTYLKVILRDLGLLALAGWLVVRPGSRFALLDRPTPQPTNVTEENR